jgi:hypothetical protein
VRPPGAYKLSKRRSVGALLGPAAASALRSQKILDSLRSEIAAGGGSHLRIRQVFHSPREIFRLELELPEYCYQRTTLLDREALEELLETDEVAAAFGGEGAGDA